MRAFSRSLLLAECGHTVSSVWGAESSRESARGEEAAERRGAVELVRVDRGRGLGARVALDPDDLHPKRPGQPAHCLSDPTVPHDDDGPSLHPRSGRGEALLETERRVETLRDELEGLRRSRAKVFQVPPLDWIEERLSGLQGLLERRTEQSALLLRTLLGPISLEPITGDIGRPYYLARTAVDCLALCETPPGAEAPDGGSNSLRQWTRMQRIRTAAALPLEVLLVDTLDPPTYQQIAPKARHLRELGLSDRTIARRLGVTDKSVAKAIRWLEETSGTGQPPLTRPSSE